MGKVLVTEQYLSDIADQIREKLQTDVQYTPAQMADAISLMQGDRLPERLACTLSGVFGDETTTMLGDYALAGCTGITSVIFSAMTSIGTSALRACTGIKSVSMPLLTTVGSSAFYGCTGLTDVDLPLAATLGTYAFYGCTGLVNLSLPAATTFNNYAFQNCTKLKKLVIPKATSLNYTSMFIDDTSLEEVDCGGRALGRLGATLFSGCTKLKRVNATFTSTNTSSFINCKALNGDGIDLSKCTSIAATTFSGCSSLTDLYLTYNGTTSLANTSAFTGTPIASKTGTIHVPASRLATYKAAARWSTYASIMVGDL